MVRHWPCSRLEPSYQVFQFSQSASATVVPTWHPGPCSRDTGYSTSSSSSPDQWSAASLSSISQSTVHHSWRNKILSSTPRMFRLWWLSAFKYQQLISSDQRTLKCNFAMWASVAIKISYFVNLTLSTAPFQISWWLRMFVKTSWCLTLLMDQVLVTMIAPLNSSDLTTAVNTFSTMNCSILTLLSSLLLIISVQSSTVPIQLSPAVDPSQYYFGASNPQPCCRYHWVS